MKSLGLRKGLWFAALAIMCLMALPAASSAQGRGHWRNRGNQDWKRGRFVNGHDARDGRWDRDRRRNIFRNNDYWQRNRQRERFYNRNNRYQRSQYPYNYAVRNRYQNRDGNRRNIVRYRRW